ncbi:MAG: alpha-ketoglutarate-dependent dioxygenase AlkB [Myxococcales bacterium]|nr:alpha-ketoglutarate-dependent dioxygenase AlkB [Myxococcales bacterium]
MQLSLLDQVAPAADAGFATARRMDLGSGAWIEVVPEWCCGHLRLMDQLLAAADWERHARIMYEREVEVPRLVAGCPGGSGQLPLSGETVLEKHPHRAGQTEIDRVRGLLDRMSTLLSQRYRRRLDRIRLAFYRDGRDSVAFHGDKLGTLRSDTVVAVLSLGARRRFLLRPVDRRRARGRAFRPGEGDLLVMGGNCQETWEHAVPKQKHAGPRLAIMFREPVTPSAAQP